MKEEILNFIRKNRYVTAQEIYAHFSYRRQDIALMIQTLLNDGEIIFEDDRYFEIIIAKFNGKRKSLDELDFYFSKSLINKKDKVYLAYLSERKVELEKILNKINKDNKRSIKRRDELINLLKRTEEAIDEISN